jgi:small GTP-binding protein
MHEFRIVLIGATDSGKTTLLSAFIDEELNPTLKKTIAAAYRQHQVELLDTRFSLKFVDTNGSTTFNQTSGMYCKNAQAILIVCDLSQNDFVTSTQQLLANIAQHLTEKTLIYLIGTKRDLVQDQPAAQRQLLTLLQHRNIVAAHAVSAINLAEVKPVFDDLIFDLADRYKDTPTSIRNPIIPAPASVENKPKQTKEIWQRIRAHPWRYTIGLVLAISLIILLTVPIAGQAAGLSAAVSWLLINTAMQLGTSLLVTKIILAISLGTLAFFLPSILAASFNAISGSFKAIRNKLDGLSLYLSNLSYKTKNILSRALLQLASFFTYMGSALMHFCSQMFKRLSLCIRGRRKLQQIDFTTSADDIESSYSKMPQDGEDKPKDGTEQPIIVPATSKLFKEGLPNATNDNPHPQPFPLKEKRG